MSPLADPDPGVDPDLRWIRIIESLDPDPESELPESPKELKSDSRAGSRAGIVTPLIPAASHQSQMSFTHS